MTELLQQLIDFIKSASPIVWEALVRQVYVEAVSYAAWAVLTTIVVFIWIRLAKWAKKEKKKANKNVYNEWGTAEGFFWVAAVVFVLISFGLFVTSGRLVATLEPVTRGGAYQSYCGR